MWQSHRDNCANIWWKCYLDHWNIWIINVYKKNIQIKWSNSQIRLIKARVWLYVLRMNLFLLCTFNLLTIISQDITIFFFFFVIIALQITRNSKSFGDLYSLEYQIFDRKDKWLDLKLEMTSMTIKENEWKEWMNEWKCHMRSLFINLVVTFRKDMSLR